MSLFNDKTLSLVSTSIKRAFVLAEEDRQVYATKLLDMYQGFGMKYVKQEINKLKSEIVKSYMKNVAVCFPILQNFIKEISMVYKIQPTRTFYKDGKQIISEKPDEKSILDPNKFVIDKELYEKLEGIYDREFAMKIKEAECKTNLLSTTVYKINNREGKLKLDFIPNDAAVAVSNKEDRTMIDGFYYGKNTSLTPNKTVKMEWEKWTTTEWYTSQNQTPQENRAVTAYKKWTENKDALHIGSGFAPFAVLRSQLADFDFWDLRDQDITLAIIQINLAWTELRYLQRYASFGLKYGIDVKLPSGATSDPTGFWEFQSQNDGNIPGGESKAMVGELSNSSKILELVESILHMIKFLYDMYGIDTSSLITTKQATTAESKKIDREALRKTIEKQQEIWTINEEVIFQTAVSVYNRDNSDAIPSKVDLRLDFYDAEKAAEESAVEIENWLVKIENDVSTYLDWIMTDNPDLNEEEAKKLYEKNIAINATNKDENEDEDKDEDDPLGLKKKGEKDNGEKKE